MHVTLDKCLKDLSKKLKMGPRDTTTVVNEKTPDVKPWQGKTSGVKTDNQLY